MDDGKLQEPVEVVVSGELASKNGGALKNDAFEVAANYCRFARIGYSIRFTAQEDVCFNII